MSKSTHIVLRDLYLAKHPDTCYGLGEWRRFNTGIWPEVPALTVRRELQAIAVARNGCAVTNGLIESVANLLKAWVAVPDDEFDSKNDILTFADRTLNLTTREVREHQQADYVTSKLPFDYDPEARSETLEIFLRTTVPEYASFLQEYAGYCLTPSTRYELALWLWGPPGGGKSTFIEGLATMLGSRVCSLGLNEIENSRFALTPLIGKTLAVSTEQPSHFIKAPQALNAIISGELIPVDRKFRDPISFRPHAKLLWAMNELPRIDSGGVGLFRRIVPIYFPAIAEDSRDPKIKEQLITEGMGIVNWALAGLSRLTERNKFDIPATLIEEREVYRVQNDIPQVFLDERCEHTESAEIQSSLLYDSYKSWCSDNGHKPLSSTLFARELLRLGINKRILSGRKFWTGLQLREEPDYKVN